MKFIAHEKRKVFLLEKRVGWDENDNFLLTALDVDRVHRWRSGPGDPLSSLEIPSLCLTGVTRPDNDARDEEALHEPSTGKSEEEECSGPEECEGPGPEECEGPAPVPGPYPSWSW